MTTKIQLQNDVKTFLQNGGHVQKIASGVRTVKTIEANENLNDVLLEIASLQNLNSKIEDFINE